jgi:hypothetical protein
MLGFPYIRFHHQPRITNSNLQMNLELPRTRPEGDGYRTLPVTLTRWVMCAVSSGGSTVREARDLAPFLRLSCHRGQGNFKGAQIRLKAGRKFFSRGLVDTPACEIEFWRRKRYLFWQLFCMIELLRR